MCKTAKIIGVWLELSRTMKDSVIAKVVGIVIYSLKGLSVRFA